MNNRETRPWGWFETIEEAPNYKLKKIYVNPNQQFSLQYHNNRDEHWIIVEGSGVITLGNERSFVKENNSFFIEREQNHRMTSGNNGILFYEVQMGFCNEEDIVRIEDDYGRVEWL